MLKTKIFAGSITNLTDARYFAARGVHYLGFNLDDGADANISVEKMMAIKEWVEGPEMVGAFQLSDPDDIKYLIDRLNLDMIQVGPFSSIESIQHLEQKKPIIKEVIIEDLENLQQIQNQLETLSSFVDFWLLNFEKNGLSWPTIEEDEGTVAQLKNWCTQYQLMLAIPHQSSETIAMIKALKPYGLYVQGGDEEKTGFKSYDELDEIFDVLELDGAW